MARSGGSFANGDVFQPLLDRSFMASRGLEELGAIIREETVKHFNTLLERYPDTAVKWLSESGVKPLAQFAVKEGVVRRAFTGKDTLVLGSSLHVDFDVECMWNDELERLAPEQYKHIGFEPTVKVEASVVNVMDATRAQTGLLHGVLQLHNATNSLALFKLTAVQALLWFKWNAWGQRVLVAELALHLTWLLAFTVAVAAFSGEPSSQTLPEVLHTRAGKISVTADVLAFVLMVVHASFNLVSLARGGLLWWLTPVKAGYALAYVLQALITWHHLLRVGLGSTLFSGELAVQSVTLWLLLNHFIQAADPATCMRGLSRLLWDDLRYFLLFMLSLILAASTALAVVVRHFGPEGGPEELFGSFVDSFLEVFTLALGPFPESVAWRNKNVAVAGLAFVVALLLNVLMSRVLVAVMVNSYEKMSEDAELLRLVYVAKIIEHYETCMPAWLVASQWAQPRYLHTLQLVSSAPVDRLDQLAKQMDHLLHATHSMQDGDAKHRHEMVVEVAEHVKHALKSVHERLMAVESLLVRVSMSVGTSERLTAA